MVTYNNNEDHLTVSLSGVLNLTSGVDTLCYNHTLERVFQNRPGIAICTNINNFSRIRSSKSIQS